MTLFAHQQKIIDADPKKYGIFHGTGSGKTRTALHLARGNTLVICPKTQAMDRTWERELQKLDMDNPPHITVMSKETFKRDVKKLSYFETIIGDEAHTLCGVTPFTRQRRGVIIPKASQTFEALDWYIRHHQPERVYLTTATPIPQPMAVWGAAKLLGHQYNYSEFRDTFYVRVNIRGREIWMPKRDEDAKNMLASIVRKIGVTGRLQDWYDVPEQTFKTIQVGMTKEQLSKVSELRLLYPDPIVQIGKFHQLEQGIYEGEFLPQEKFEIIEEHAEEFEKVLIFCKYTRQIVELYEYLTSKGFPVLCLTGQTKERGKLRESAEALPRCVVIAQSSISAGYELPSFGCTIYASKSYSFVDWEQSIGRTLRANHLKKNLYVSLDTIPYLKMSRSTVSMDNLVSGAVENKQDFSERMYCEQEGLIYTETDGVDNVDSNFNVE